MKKFGPFGIKLRGKNNYRKGTIIDVKKALEGNKFYSYRIASEKDRQKALKKSNYIEL